MLSWPRGIWAGVPLPSSFSPSARGTDAPESPDPALLNPRTSLDGGGLLPPRHPFLPAGVCSGTERSHQRGDHTGGSPGRRRHFCNCPSQSRSLALLRSASRGGGEGTGRREQGHQDGIPLLLPLSPLSWERQGPCLENTGA